MKIMIVEDDPVIRDLVEESLIRWGFETIKVINYELILQDFKQSNPHLVLMDINLPTFDGFYWCQKIREISNVPMIFLSSRNTPMDMVMSMNIGGDDYVQKPFHTDVLIAKINALLRRSYSYMDVQINKLDHDGVIFNLEDGTIRYEGQTSVLTKTESIILKILMKQKGTVISRKNMMRSLWDDESFIDENTLSVNMVRLRKKLDSIGKKNWIVTKKGQGYLIL
ncbi:response regulator transcription factor [Shimazuella alba]|uniref:Response regulator n=1 Tax=Shimazuella alba TaxID=2690964 RepID=A0A6I4VVL8_9BACL|nr:response regulator transcription factor [Shimazuella alba]MXQ55557.1 response regulator [Shimazuella alba]